MQLNSMSRRYLYIDIANKIEQMILNDKINEGEKLPSENELSRSLGVSRNIVRESLKTLMERGLVDIKTGKGAYVVIPKFDMFNDLLTRINKMNKVPFGDLLDLRYALEVNAAGFAAERADEKDIKKIENSLKKMECSKNAQEWGRNDTNFHIAISDATHNLIYSSITYAISDLYRKSFTHSFNNDLLSNSMKIHKKILCHIIQKDRKGAEEAARSLIELHALQMNTKINNL